MWVYAKEIACWWEGGLTADRGKGVTAVRGLRAKKRELRPAHNATATGKERKVLISLLFHAKKRAFPEGRRGEGSCAGEPTLPRGGGSALAKKKKLSCDKKSSALAEKGGDKRT